MSREVVQLPLMSIALRAGSALHKIDRQGPRGVTLCSADEIEAMAAALAIFGVMPIPPDTPPPANILTPFRAPLKGHVNDPV